MESLKISGEHVSKKKLKTAKNIICNVITNDLLKSRNAHKFVQKIIDVCLQFEIEPWQLQDYQDQQKNFECFFLSADILTEEEEKVLDLKKPWKKQSPTVDPFEEKPEFGLFFSVGSFDELKEVWTKRGLTTEQNLYRLKRCGIRTPKVSAEYAASILKDQTKIYYLKQKADIQHLATGVCAVFVEGKLTKVTLNVEISDIIEDIDKGNIKSQDFDENPKSNRSEMAKVILSCITNTLKSSPNKKELLDSAKQGIPICVKLELENASAKKPTPSPSPNVAPSKEVETPSKVEPTSTK